MKTTSAIIFALFASATAFAPQPSLKTITPSQLSMAEYNKEGWMGQRSSDEKHQDMWEAQQELQQHRREHSSSKEERMKKYSGESTVENDKHHELLEPWTKDNNKDDHNSKGLGRQSTPGTGCTMKYRYCTCDVFTTERFGDVIDRQGVQFLETFCLKNRTVRIFTPTTEVPFAGHPNIGTAFCLAATGDLGEITQEGLSISLQQKAGPVPISIRRDNSGHLTCELQAPQALSTGPKVSLEQMAEILSISCRDIDDTVHAPMVASVGLPFLFARVKDLVTLGRIKINLPALELLAKEGIASDVHVYCCCGDDEHDAFIRTNGEQHAERTQQLCARMFAPMDNVPEDPATGSANAEMAALLTSLDNTATTNSTTTLSMDSDSDLSFSWTVRQGVEMGRPSVLHARTIKDASSGQVKGT
eukprot:scaffold2243_cov165-Amphora_coffeaeformis.AAC.3